MVGGFADDIILFLLDGCNDFSQHSLLVFGKVFRKQFIVCYHFAVVIVQKLSVFDLVGPFQLQVNGDFSVPRRCVAAFAKTILIIGVCYRCSPVNYGLVGSVFENSPLTNVNTLLLFQQLIIEVRLISSGLSSWK